SVIPIELRDTRTLDPLLERALAAADDPQVRLEIAQMLAAIREVCGDSIQGGEVAHAFLHEAELGDGMLLPDALWFSAFWEIACDRSPWPLVERGRSLPPTGTSGGWPMHPAPKEILARAALREGRIDEARSLVDRWFAEVGDDGPMHTQHGQFRLLASIEL